MFWWMVHSLADRLAGQLVIAHKISRYARLRFSGFSDEFSRRAAGEIKEVKRG